VRKIISSIDIGSSYVKLVVGEFIQDDLHILCASKVSSSGIERGKIVDADRVVASVKNAINEASKTLGVKIEKCVLGLDMTNSKLQKSATAIKVTSADYVITGKEINDIFSKCADGKVGNDYVLVSVVPVEFTIDNDKVVTNPLGLTSENLGLKAIVVSSPKDYVSSMLEIANKAGLKIIDVAPNALGDYYAFKKSKTDDKIGVILNLGAEISTVSVFNRGIIINTNTFPLGTNNIIKDIAFINKLSDSEASAIFKDIVLASSRLASTNEYRIVTNLEGEEVKLNQFEVSEIALSRIVEILNLAKKQINILTKKEISYIIISGGLTELRDFNLVAEDEFGELATVARLNLIGVRDNSYSSAVGILKYFQSRLELKGKGYSIFSTKDLENMGNNAQIENVNNNSLLGKVFGYFFDN